MNQPSDYLQGRPCVLVIDDAPDNIELLRATLSDTYRIKAATSGQRALDIVFREAPDLILLDITMPEMDGYAVCRRIKSDPETARIPIIFVTASQEAGHEELGFSLGAADYITKPFEPAVVRARVATHLSLYDQTRLLEDLVQERTQQLRHEMDQREKAVERIRYLHDYDSLTGLPNRQLLLQRISAALGRNPGQVAVGVLDINRFSAINDALGTLQGDRLLKQVADTLRKSVQGSDTVGRLAGDAFGIILIGESLVMDRLHLVTEKVDQLFNATAGNYDVEGERVQISMSAGLALHPHDGESAEALLKSADAAMHVAKQSSATPHVFYDPAMNAASRELLILESELRDAIRSEAIQPWYQPKFNLSDRRVIGAEALARWHTGDRRRIGPDQFIPLAEKTGQIRDLNIMITHSVCRQVRDWTRKYGESMKFAFNLSAVDFQYPGLVNDLIRVTEDTGVKPSLLELEITENAVVSDVDAAAEKIQALRALGFSVALDDFGVGYSSLSYIKHFKLDALKIDKSFMANVGSDAESNAIGATLLTLAHRLGMTSVGEGVENETQFKFLQENQCELVQGFLFSPALPASEFESRFLDLQKATTGV